MELPTEIVKAERVNPKTLLLFALPKVGKTTILSKLENNLIVDLEEGSKFVDALKIEINSFEEMKDLIKSLNKKKKETGELPYKYITLDTVTALEDMILPYAAEKYKDTSMGKNWKGDDVRKLPNGSGYLYMREAFFEVINYFTKFCDTLILVGHLKDKLIERDGQEHTEKSVDLTGKIKSLTAAKVDAIGYMYAKDNSRYINFEPSEEVISGNRAAHLSGKTIKVSEKKEDGKINIMWNEIFIS